MHRRLFNLVAILLLTCTYAAGQQLSVYTAAGPDAYEIRHVGEILCTPDNFQIGVEPAYRYREVDSITINRPSALDRRRGWWGDPIDGPLCYYTQVEYTSAVIAVCYTVTFTDGICQSVICDLEVIGILDTDQINGDPYIYVKSTTTGPRLHEEWEMGFAHVVPKQAKMDYEGESFTGNCTPLLKGRTIDEVKGIVEAWIYQEAEKVAKEGEDKP